MTKRVATEGVAAQQHEVGEQNQCAEAHPEPTVEPERVPHVARQYDQKHQGQIKKIAVDILQDQGKGALTKIFFSRLAHSAGRRVGPKGLVVRAAIVVAGHSKPARRPKDEHRCRYPGGHPVRLGAKPALIATAKQFRGIERGEIRSEAEVLSLEGCPRRINNERRQSEKHSQRLYPPAVCALRLSKSGARQWDVNVRHRASSLAHFTRVRSSPASLALQAVVIIQANPRSVLKTDASEGTGGRIC